MTLSNGQVIWDFAGNGGEWTTTIFNGGQPGAAGAAWREWNAVANPGTLWPSPFPAYATPAASAWGSTQNLGLVNSDTSQMTTRGVIRGGGTSSGSNAGIFSLTTSQAPTAYGVNFLFRIVEVK